MTLLMAAWSKPLISKLMALPEWRLCVPMRARSAGCDGIIAGRRGYSGPQYGALVGSRRTVRISSKCNRKCFIQNHQFRDVSYRFPSFIIPLLMILYQTKWMGRMMYFDFEPFCYNVNQTKEYLRKKGGTSFIVRKSDELCLRNLYHTPQWYLPYLSWAVGKSKLSVQS